MAATVAWPSAARAQQHKVWRVGWLDAGSAPRGDNFEAFRQGLKELGYAEGMDVVIEQRFADGNIDRLPMLAGDLVRMNVDVILAVASFAVQAAKGATTEVPIVMMGVGDPVRSGFVASIRRFSTRCRLWPKAIGIEISSIEVRGADEIERVLEGVALEGLGALIVPPDSTWPVKARRIADLALKNRLPAMFGFAGAVKSGDL